MKEKILVGISGGVDSASALLLLKEQGYDVYACTLSLLGAFGIPSAEDRAAMLCDSLSVPLSVVDGSDDFKRLVTDPFYRAYRDGLTPNPCVLCNPRVKFALLLREADRLGITKIATGHYARIGKYGDRVAVLKAADRRKDQTYMLTGLSQETLSRVVFPLGDMIKPDIRAYAASHGLPNAGAPDSQDICFVPDGDYMKFLQTYYGVASVPGHFTDTDGCILGTHDGMMRFTVGQRKGFGMGFRKRVYVIGKNAASGDVILGDDADLYTDHAIIADWNGIALDTPTFSVRGTAKVRYSQNETPALLEPLGDGRYRVTFETPVRAVTPGQLLALYDNDALLGGGFIQNEVTL